MESDLYNLDDLTATSKSLNPELHHYHKDTKLLLSTKLKYHNNRGSAFVLKPPHLREEDAIELDTPKKQDPRLNMAEKPVITPMYRAPL